MPLRSHDEAVVESFHEDPEYALDLLNSVLEDGDSGELLITMRQFTKAFGGMQAVAEKADLNPTQLYRSLSAEGNPTLNSLRAVLKAMGMQIAVRRIGDAIETSGKSQAPKRARKKPTRAKAKPAVKVPAARQAQTA